MSEAIGSMYIGIFTYMNGCFFIVNYNQYKSIHRSSHQSVIGESYVSLRSGQTGRRQRSHPIDRHGSGFTC